MAGLNREIVRMTHHLVSSRALKIELPVTLPFLLFTELTAGRVHADSDIASADTGTRGQPAPGPGLDPLPIAARVDGRRRLRHGIYPDAGVCPL